MYLSEIKEKSIDPEAWVGVKKSTNCKVCLQLVGWPERKEEESDVDTDSDFNSDKKTRRPVRTRHGGPPL